MKELTSVLSKIQKDLNVPKDRKNKFAGYSYRNAEDIIEAAKKIMPPNSTLTMSDEILLIGDRFYLKATATFTYMGESISCSGLAREPEEKKGSDASQITGGCSTYARRYALSGLLAIDDGEDTDNHDNREEPKKAQQEKPIPSQAPKKESKDTDIVSKEMVFKLSKLTFDAKLDTKKLYETYKVKSLDQLNIGQAKYIAECCKEIIADKDNNELTKAATKVFGKEDYLTV